MLCNNNTRCSVKTNYVLLVQLCAARIVVSRCRAVSSANLFWQMHDPHLGRHAIAYVCKGMQGAHTGRVGLGQNR